MQAAVKIFVVDDHQLIISGLKEIIGDSKTIEWIGEANNGQETLRALELCSPDVIIMDLNMPKMDGFTLIPILKERYPAIKIIVLSMYDDPNVVRRLRQLGIHGFIPKNADPAELKGAIINVASGQQYFSPVVLEAFLKINKPDTTTPADDFSKMALLTERETEIVKCIVGGLSNIETADKLFISVRTVETHRNNIMKKLGIRSVVDLVKLAMKTGIA